MLLGRLKRVLRVLPEGGGGVRTLSCRPHAYADDENEFKLRKALIVSKLSRFEFEQMRYPELNALQLERQIRDRGTDYDSLVSYNEQHVDFRRQVVDSFKQNNVEVKVVDR